MGWSFHGLDCSGKKTGKLQTGERNQSEGRRRKVPGEKPAGGDTTKLQPQEGGTNNNIYLNRETAPIRVVGGTLEVVGTLSQTLHSFWGLPLSSPSHHHPHWFYQR